MSTDVDICNQALAFCGVDPIVSITPPDASKSARACALMYPISRNFLSASGDWNFACTWVQLDAADATAPIDGYTYRHALPGNVLHVLAMKDTLDRFNVVDDYLHSDVAQPVIKYIRKTDPAGRFAAGYIEALSSHLASKLALALRKDAALSRTMFERFIWHRDDAQSTDSMEGSPEQAAAGSLERVR